MKLLLRLLPLLALAAAPLRAADADPFAALRAADDERIAAMVAADPARLAAVLSADLHYGHSNGLVEDYAAFRNALVSRATSYRKLDYVRRDFRIAAPGVVLMTGRVLVEVELGGQQLRPDLNFLAVWRLEEGRWRFLAWQSVRNPPPAK